MAGRGTIKALLFASVVLLAAQCFGADDPPNEGRVPLTIKAADPDGGELFFEWKQIEGPHVNIADPHARRFDKNSKKWISETYFVPKVEGKYVFEVTVRNENNLTSSKRFVQEVLPPPQLPNADPGKPQTVKANQKVVVSGVDSKAYDNRVITKYEWTVKTAPADFSLTPEQLSSRQFEFTPKNAGKYVFELKVHDGKFWSDPVSVEVEVTQGRIIVDQDPPPEPVPLPPKVKGVGGDNTTPAKIKAVATVQNGDKPFRVGDRIVLDGSTSTAGDNDEFTWKQLEPERSVVIRPITPDVNKAWSKLRNDPYNYPVQSFIATDNGTFKFVLQIKSKETGAVAESEPATIQVGSAGGDTNNTNTTKGPVVVLEPMKATITLGGEVKLDGSKSHSEDGSPLTYMWMQLPNRNYPVVRGGNDGPIVRVYAEKEGEYGLALVVQDKNGRHAQSEPVTITVVAGDKAPAIEGLDKAYTCNLGEVIGLKARITDPQNYAVTLKWTLLESPRKLVIPPELASASEFRFAPPDKGTYIFRLEATNSKGMTSAVETQVGVKDAGILKPTAVISAPGQERVNVGDKVTLSAAQSYSPNRKPLAYTWRDESEGGPKIKEPVPGRNAKEWTFVASAPGRIVVTLAVNDSVADSEPAKFAVDVMAAAVPKGKPIAKIDGPHSAMAKSEVELSAEGSTSADNTPLQYAWTQVPPPEGGADLGLSFSQRHAAKLRFIPTQPGTYILTLVVIDQNNEQSAVERFALEVKGAPAAAPTAAASVLTPAPLSAGKEVRLSGKESVSPANLPLQYKWEQTKGVQLVLARDNTQEIVVTPAKAGQYEFKLTVSDGQQQSAPAAASFNVEAGELPKAIIADIQQPTAGDTVTLDGSGSTGPGGATREFLKYKWEQRKGTPVRLNVGDDAKSKLQFVVPEEGVYVFDLRVSEDGNEWSTPTSITFPVKARANAPAPQVVVEKSTITTEVGVEAAIDASKSTDPENLPLQFKWSKNGREFAERGPILKFTWEDVAQMVFEVQAFNGKTYSEKVQVQVNVVAAGTLPKSLPKITLNGQPVSPANPAKISFPNMPDPKKVIVLDASDSTQANPKPLAYLWRQVGGKDLGLKSESMSKERVGLRIYKPGEYKFELTVKEVDNEKSVSSPTTVSLKVEDDQPPPAPPPDPPKN